LQSLVEHLSQPLDDRAVHGVAGQVAFLQTIPRHVEKRLLRHPLSRGPGADVVPAIEHQRLALAAGVVERGDDTWDDT
jgi:hypothetical protein